MEWYDSFGEYDNSENLEEVSSRWKNFPPKNNACLPRSPDVSRQ